MYLYFISTSVYLASICLSVHMWIWSHSFQSLSRVILCVCLSVCLYPFYIIHIVWITLLPEPITCHTVCLFVCLSLSFLYIHIVWITLLPEPMSHVILILLLIKSPHIHVQRPQDHTGSITVSLIYLVHSWILVCVNWNSKYGVSLQKICYRTRSQVCYKLLLKVFVFTLTSSNHP